MPETAHMISGIASLVLGAMALAALIVACVTAPWRSVASHERSHVWWGAVLVTTLAWIMQPAEHSALHMHFLGATALYLMFGARLALIGIAIASAAATLAGHAAWSEYLPDLFLAGVLPIVASRLVLGVARRRLPAHVFVYIFVCGFAAAGLSVLLAELASLVAADAMTVVRWGSGTLAVLALLIAFAEATLTGMVVSIMVAYRPGWLASFDERRYLAPPRDGGAR